MPFVVASLANSKSKERKSVAAHVCGVLAGFVSEHRCKALIETLKLVQGRWRLLCVPQCG
jgi:hypothetical protein